MSDVLTSYEAARLSAPDATTPPAHRIRKLARGGQIPSAILVVDRWRLESEAYQAWLAEYVAVRADHDP